MSDTGWKIILNEAKNPTILSSAHTASGFAHERSSRTLKDMDSLSLHVGSGRLVSYSPLRELPWRVVFEDEGIAGYCYACDGRLATVDDEFDVTVLDSMLVYNVAAMHRDPEGDRERLLTVEWSADGQQAALRLDGIPQVLVDFQNRQSFCRSNFPNFMQDSAVWRATSHAWDDDAMTRFEEAALAGN